METIKAVIYIRVSSEEQVKHGYSLQSQRERLIDYCKEHRYQLINIYVDEGKSARSKLKNRKALLQLVEDAKKSKFNRIIIWRLDRWFRNIADYYKIQEILDQYHVDWECSDEEYNTTTSNGRLHLNIKLSIAQNESDQTSDRIKFNFENMVKNKRAIVGKQGLPLGYTISGEEKNKKVVKDKTTEQIVNDMWDNIQITGSIRQTMIYINNKYNLSICYDSMRHYFMNTKYYGCYRVYKVSASPKFHRLSPIEWPEDSEFKSCLRPYVAVCRKVVAVGPVLSCINPFYKNGCTFPLQIYKNVYVRCASDLFIALIVKEARRGRICLPVIIGVECRIRTYLCAQYVFHQIEFQIISQIQSQLGKRHNFLLRR